MKKIQIGIFLLILISIPGILAEQSYNDKALNYDSYIQTSTLYTAILFGILALVIGFVGFLGWRFFEKMIKDSVKEECKQDNLDIKEYLKRLDDRINSMEKGQKGNGERDVEEDKDNIFDKK